MASWKINGLDVASALGLQLTQDTSWRPGVSNRRTTVELPGIHGNINIGLPVYDEAQVTMDAYANAATEAALEEAILQFSALCGAPGLALTRTSGGVTSAADAELVSIAYDQWVPGVSTHIVAVFAIPGVFFRGPFLTTADISVPDFTAREIAELSGSSAPITDPIFRFHGPLTYANLTDPASGTGLEWTGSITASQYLFLRPRPLMARISSSSGDWTSGGVSDLDSIGYPAAGRIQLFPVVTGAATRQIQLSFTGSGRTTDTALAIRTRKAYL